MTEKKTEGKNLKQKKRKERMCREIKEKIRCFDAVKGIEIAENKN